MDGRVGVKGKEGEREKVQRQKGEKDIQIGW